MENVLHYTVLIASIIIAFTIAKGRERIRVGIALVASIALQIITCNIFYCGGVCVIYSVMLGLSANLAQREKKKTLAISITAGYYAVLLLAAGAAAHRIPHDRKKAIRMGLVAFSLHTFLFMAGYGIGYV